jgi:hypothetical protein
MPDGPCLSCCRRGCFGISAQGVVPVAMEVMAMQVGGLEDRYLFVGDLDALGVQGPGIVVFQLFRSSAIGRWGSRA